MEVLVSVKSIGKRKATIEEQLHTLQGEAETLAQLIELFVRQNVRTYNERPTEEWQFLYETEAQVNEAAATGKVAFGTKYNEQLVDEERAVAVAMQAFRDGLFKAFVNGIDIEQLDERLPEQRPLHLLFLRLTMLTGRYW